MPTNYLERIAKKHSEAKQHGVKGMRWGVRRSRSQLAKSKKSSGETDKETAKSSESSGGKGGTGPPEKKPVYGAASDETSSERYARLTAVAKSGGANTLNEQDLKFFNARTEALRKIEKMYETEPSWLSSTTKKVLQKTAERQMQSLSDTLADKYLGGPLANLIKNPPKSDNSKPKATEMPKITISPSSTKKTKGTGDSPSSKSSEAKRPGKDGVYTVTDAKKRKK